MVSFLCLLSETSSFEKGSELHFDYIIPVLLPKWQIYFHVHNPLSARIFNIYPRKGAIRAGSDADIIILNPNSSFEISAKSHHSRSDTNVYEGWRGKVIWSLLFCYMFHYITVVPSNFSPTCQNIPQP
jgi:hypothetical protein